MNISDLPRAQRSVVALRSECGEAVVVNEEGCPGNVRPECYACGFSEC